MNFLWERRQQNNRTEAASPQGLQAAALSTYFNPIRLGDLGIHLPRRMRICPRRSGTGALRESRISLPETVRGGLSQQFCSLCFGPLYRTLESNYMPWQLSAAEASTWALQINPRAHRYLCGEREPGQVPIVRVFQRTFIVSRRQPSLGQPFGHGAQSRIKVLVWMV